jgi:hypothetical protein
MKPNIRVKFVRFAHTTASELRSFAAFYAGRYMSFKALIASSMLMCGLACAETAPVQVRLGHDLGASALFARYEETGRQITFKVQSEATTRLKSVSIRVIGTITDLDVQSMTSSILKGGNDFWLPQSKLDIRVISDKTYALVVIVMSCGDLCGSTTSYSYENKNGKWQYVYKLTHSIS